MKSKIVIYNYKELTLLNQKETLIPKITMKELKKSKDNTFFQNCTEVCIQINQSIVLLISVSVLSILLKRRKFELQEIKSLDVPYELFVNNIYYFKLLSRKGLNPILVCSEKSVFNRNISVHNIMFLTKSRKKVVFSYSQKLISFKLNNNCDFCDYYYICGGAAPCKKKECIKIQSVIKDKYLKEFKNEIFTIFI